MESGFSPKRTEKIINDNIVGKNNDERNGTDLT